VKSTPSPSNYNRFSVLSVDSIPEIDESVEPTKDVPKTEPVRCFRPCWERSLPKRLVVASTEDEPRSLKLKVSIETTDTAEVKSVNSLVDSGATGNFIDQDYVRTHRLTTRLYETKGVVKNNPKGCHGIKLMKRVVFRDCGNYYFLHCKINSTV
jgi:hypothetical protein